MKKKILIYRCQSAHKLVVAVARSGRIDCIAESAVLASLTWW